MPDHNIEVIDLGLTVPQAIDGRAGDREFTRRKELPTDLELDDDAREWFTGEVIRGEDGEPVLHKGKLQYDTTRCELNAFSSDGLADVHRGRSGTARRHREARAPTGSGGRACADGSRRGAHRDGLGRDRGHGRRRCPGAPTDRRPSGSGRRR